MQSLKGKSKDWAFDVWDCWIVFKKREWGMGKGYIPEIDGIEFVQAGEFSFPTKRKPTDKEKSKVQKFLEKEFYDACGGAPSRSGFYDVSKDFIENFKKICF